MSLGSRRPRPLGCAPGPAAAPLCRSAPSLQGQQLPPPTRRAQPALPHASAAASRPGTSSSLPAQPNEAARDRRGAVWRTGAPEQLVVIQTQVTAGGGGWGQGRALRGGEEGGEADETETESDHRTALHGAPPLLPSPGRSQTVWTRLQLKGTETAFHRYSAQKPGRVSTASSLGALCGRGTFCLNSTRRDAHFPNVFPSNY